MRVLYDSFGGAIFVCTKCSKEQVYAQLMRYECKRCSREEVCADMGMSTGSFWYWLRKYRNDVNESVSFVELEELTENAYIMTRWLTKEATVSERSALAGYMLRESDERRFSASWVGFGLCVGLRRADQ